jgi:hypothetical protein
MTPKEEAKELLDRFLDEQSDTDEISQARRCALICVERLKRCLPSINGRPPNYQLMDEYVSEYWEEVKQEIEKL